MSSIVLAGRSFSYGPKLSRTHLLSATTRISRAASLNSAIDRGLRKSKGVGFRGKERVPEKIYEGVGLERSPSAGIVRRSSGPPLFSGQLTYEGWRKESRPPKREERTEPKWNNPSPGSQRGSREANEVQIFSPSSSRPNRGESNLRSSSLRLRRGKKDITDYDEAPKRRTRAGRFNDPEYSFGKRALERRTARIEKAGGQGEKWDPLTGNLKSDYDSSVTTGRMRPTMTSAARRAASRAAESDRTALERNPAGARLSKGRQAYLSRNAEPSPGKTFDESFDRPHSGGIDGGLGYTRRGRDWSQDNTGQPSRDSDWPRSNTNGQLNRERRPGRDNEDTRSIVPRTVSDRLPLSIPYTTPASEFLYGTSVVEAALRSRCEPRRKLYKLHIYKGENSESPESRETIERLANQNKVPVVPHLTSPRVLDKMSHGRPHNGFILEASPLPKLPLISLGSMTADGVSGFNVTLDYQSREEADINGTHSFIPCQLSRNGPVRKPLILYLDSVLDPGNMGGIIRTASFLGITAIAVSTRNSAPLSPVVLKASAGASESVTLFSVNKPAGFITDSKRAGWKVYAAVAPPAPRNSSPNQSPFRDRKGRIISTTTPRDPNSISRSPAITTNDLLLSNPLDDDPCILMLGNEGEGLRLNLRCKADYELSIAGGRGNGVGSLNVSVAAGVLCQAFMSTIRIGALMGKKGGKWTGVREKGSERSERDENGSAEEETGEDEEETAPGEDARERKVLTGGGDLF